MARRLFRCSTRYADMMKHLQDLQWSVPCRDAIRLVKPRWCASGKWNGYHSLMSSQVLTRQRMGANCNATPFLAIDERKSGREQVSKYGVGGVTPIVSRVEYCLRRAKPDAGRVRIRYEVIEAGDCSPSAAEWQR
jgi:hypothetical protein